MPGVWETAPFPGVVNGSLWTLYYEFGCYLLVLVLGVTTILRRRHAIAILFVVSWLGNLYVHLAQVANYDAQQVARFSLTFLSGALIHRYGHRLRASWSLVGICLVVVWLAAVYSPSYRLAASVFLAYALLAAGSLLRQPWLNLGNDISYGVYIYAFPFQQLLVTAGFAAAGPLVFFVVAAYLTLPAALASWFLVEKPILSRVRRGGLRDPDRPLSPAASPQAATAPPATTSP
jgi:peptidoglycan/LPS O-acetylase OafA/YrhL